MVNFVCVGSYDISHTVNSQDDVGGYLGCEIHVVLPSVLVVKSEKCFHQMTWCILVLNHKILSERRYD